MTYHLTANRVMGLCAFEPDAHGDAPAEVRDTKDVAKDFYRQLEEICQTHLEGIYVSIKRRAERMDVSLADRNVNEDDLEVTVLQESGTGTDFEQLFPLPPDQPHLEWPRDPIIGLFRSRHYLLEIGEMMWDLRVRPSVTACVLERQDRLSKLWWTFDGVPADSSQSPTKEDAVRFVGITTKLAEDALPDLREAYTTTLERITGKSRGAPRLAQSQLRVTLADNTDFRFSRLVDAMNLAGVTFKDAAMADLGSDLRAGADEVTKFVNETSGQIVAPSAITFVRGHGGDAAVFTKPVNEGSSRRRPKKFVISGLASSLGLISNSVSIDPEWTGQTTTPDLVRSISAARPLSARIADVGARQLDRLNAATA